MNRSIGKVSQMRLLLLSTADTELLAAHGAGHATANPSRVSSEELTGLLGGADVVVLRAEERAALERPSKAARSQAIAHGRAVHRELAGG